MKTIVDDPFFQSKNIEKRLEERQREIVTKIQSGLQNIENDYGNEDWDSEAKKMFLEIFSKLHLNEKYNKNWNGYFLKNESNKRRCFFNLEYDRFWVSYDDIWRIFEERFCWEYNKIQRFMKTMLNEHFKLNGFTPFNASFIFIP